MDRIPLFLHPIRTELKAGHLQGRICAQVSVRCCSEHWVAGEGNHAYEDNELSAELKVQYRELYSCYSGIMEVTVLRILIYLIPVLQMYMKCEPVRRAGADNVRFHSVPCQLPPPSLLGCIERSFSKARACSFWHRV